MGNLAKLAADGELTTVRVRKQFIRLDVPIDSTTTSDRSAPDHDVRPPSTRLYSPNGIGLPLMLIALLEAQSRTKPGKRAKGTAIPLRAEGFSKLGWTKLLSTPAEKSDSGRTVMTPSDKQFRQLKNALARLEEEGLIEPADRSRKTNRYEGFYLKYEDVLFRRAKANDFYRVPDDDETFFELPLEFFTHGWVHVLEDSELALLLIAIYKHQQNGGEGYTMAAGPRTLHYGLGRDSFEAHLMLDRLGLIEVTADPARYDDGKVSDYTGRGAQPHTIRFLPDGLARDGGQALLEVIDQQLGR